MSIIWKNEVIDTSNLKFLYGPGYTGSGLETISWRDDPKLPRTTDLSTRRLAMRSIVLHTVKGKRGPLVVGSKPSNRAEMYARYQATTTRQASWDYTVDTDGTVAVSNDPAIAFTWHATAFNQFSIGIELVQDEDGSTYTDQYEALIKLLDLLSMLGGIQKQYPGKNGVTTKGVLPRADEKGHLRSRDCYGIFAHHHNTKNRGEGDPGAHAFMALHKAGYEGFDFNAGEDLKVWKERQTALGIKNPDGCPGPATVAALKAAGKPNGIWVVKPA